MGDTGLELGPGAQVGADSTVLLGFGALGSARVRSNCCQNCYQARASRGVSIESMTTPALTGDSEAQSKHRRRGGGADRRLSGLRGCSP